MLNCFLKEMFSVTVLYLHRSIEWEKTVRCAKVAKKIYKPCVQSEQ